MHTVGAPVELVEDPKIVDVTVVEKVLVDIDVTVRSLELPDR